MVVVRVLLCGLGRIGSTHFRNIQSSQKLLVVGVADEDEKLRNEYSALGSCPGYANLGAALKDTKNEIHGVLICTPTATHVDLIKEALNAGKAVFCEKPISHDLTAVDEVYKLAEAKKLPLMCGFQRRSDPHFLKLKESLKKGAVGQIHKVRTISRDHPIPPVKFLKISGGLVFDCASHDCDVLRWLTEEDPVSVYAEASSFNKDIKEMNDWDTLELIFKFPSGVIGSVDVSRHSACGYDQRIEVLGEKGVIQANNPLESTVVLNTASGLLQEPYVYSFTSRYTVAYRDQVEHFADLVQGTTKTPRLTHEDVRKNCIMLHAAHEAASTGKPVKITY